MSTSADVLVIGAGLFGNIIAKTLRRDRHEVLVVDAGFAGSGSKPAACLMKPSWFSSLGKDVYDPALALLDELYGIQDVQFKVGRMRTSVHWCQPRQILQKADVAAHVFRIEHGASGRWTVDAKGGLRFTANKVIVAAGIWTENLVPVEGGVQGLSGIAFLCPTEHIDEPFVKVWAPYRQLVAFNRGDGLWVGDGTAVKYWKPERADSCRTRCMQAVGFEPKSDPIPLFGVRPYVEQKPCYLAEAKKPGLWVATGGAKNGTLAAAWCASELTKALS